MCKEGTLLACFDGDRGRLVRVPVARDLRKTLELGVGAQTSDWIVQNPDDQLSDGERVQFVTT